MDNFDSEKGVPFEEALLQLEQIVRSLDAGQTKLETALEQYEKGIKLLRHCHSVLQNTERRIEILKKATTDGSLETELVGEQAFLTDVNQPGQRRSNDASESHTEKRVSSTVQKKRVRKTTAPPESDTQDDAPVWF